MQLYMLHSTCAGKLFLTFSPADDGMRVCPQIVSAKLSGGKRKEGGKYKYMLIFYFSLYTLWLQKKSTALEFGKV
jgi:hypothetical protein